MQQDEVQKLKHGLYRLYWSSGGYSLASVGSLYDGSRWFAATNWTNPSTHGIASTNWDAVERVEMIPDRIVPEPDLYPGNHMSDKPDIIVPTGNGTAKAIRPSGEVEDIDFNKPSTQMLRQMAEVLVRRLNNRALLKMLYLETTATIPTEVQTIVRELVEDKINVAEAVRRINAWKHKLPRT